MNKELVKTVLTDNLGFSLAKLSPQISEAGLAFKDAVEQGTSPVSRLEVQVLANQSGKLINMRVYPAKLMRAGYKRWTGGSHKRPVLLHHEDNEHPVGKVIGSKFVPILKGKALNEDYKDPAINTDEPGSGNGYLTLSITDPDMIIRILRGDYDAVSTGVMGWPLYCSICGNKLYGSSCNHWPGEWFVVEDGDKKDTKLCYGITSQWDPVEVSIVNIPAFDLTKFESIKLKTDAPRSDVDALNESIRKSAIDSASNFVCYDNQGKQFNLSDEMCNITKKTTIVVDNPLKEDNVNVNKNNGNENIHELIAKVEDVNEQESTEQVETPAENIEQKQTDAVVTDDKAQDNLENKETQASDSTETEKTEETELAEAQQEEETDSTTVELIFSDEDEFATAHILASIDGEGELETELENAEDALTPFKIEELISKFKELPSEDADLDKLVEDKKLSTKQRNALKSSTFCGPGKSFPVPDCAHVTAAKRLLPRSKYSESTKKHILSCINKKAEKLNCGSSDSGSTDSQVMAQLQATNLELTQKVTDLSGQVKTLQLELDTTKEVTTTIKDEHQALVDKLSGVIRHYLRLRNVNDIDENTMDFDTLVTKAAEQYEKELEQESTDKQEQPTETAPKVIKNVRKIPGTKVTQLLK